MSISIPDKKMDDYARDCVVRLADRVDDRVLRERLLQMAREWKAAVWRSWFHRNGRQMVCELISEDFRLILSSRGRSCLDDPRLFS